MNETRETSNSMTIEGLKVSKSKKNCYLGSAIQKSEIKKDGNHRITIRACTVEIENKIRSVMWWEKCQQSQNRSLIRWMSD